MCDFQVYPLAIVDCYLVRDIIRCVTELVMKRTVALNYRTLGQCSLQTCPHITEIFRAIDVLNKKKAAIWENTKVSSRVCCSWRACCLKVNDFAFDNKPL